MNKFKKSIKIRLIIMRAYSATIALLLFLSIFFNFADYETKGLSFIIGACTGTMMLVLINIRKYAIAMKNDESLKQLYIKENDERHKLIISKTGGIAINIIISGLALGAIISGFFDEKIFITLISATVFTALVKGSLKLYYSRNI